MLDSFKGILSCLRPGSEYRNLPPRGPPENLPTLTNEEIELLESEVYGRDTNLPTYAYDSIDPSIEDDLSPKDVAQPNRETLRDLFVCGVDGSNQRINRASFYFLLTRAALINFRYSMDGKKPYHSLSKRNATGMVLTDGNIFRDDYKIYTKEVPTSDTSVSLYHLIGDKTPPLLFSYKPQEQKRSASSQAMGWAVKLQQTLELRCLGDVPQESRFICIRDGPLISTSVATQDNVEGLSKILTWNNGTLLSCSKRITESRLLLETLFLKASLRDYWFPNQNITDSTLNSIANDTLLLPRLLKPGQRTPLIAAVPRARIGVTKQEPRLTPLVCYYYSRTRPYSIIRIEIPKFMWERDKDMVIEAISITAWQHELGKKAPLVQIYADMQCQLQSEKLVIKRQINQALSQNQLYFPEVYE